MRVWWLALALVAGCSDGAVSPVGGGPSAGGGKSDGAGGGASGADGAAAGSDGAIGGSDAAAALTDDDQDGLDDAQELAWARAYLPYISHSPTEQCKTGGLLVRVSPHAQDPTLVHIIYDYLYNDDCGTAIGGIGGHDGDDEVFAATIDPAQPPPAGIIALKAISHQGTPCERDSTCGKCSGLTACATLPIAGVAWPAVWPSKDKHGSYVDRADSCSAFATCFDECDDATAPTVPEIVNAGEPAHPLIHDLTDHGFITTANGWTHMELFHFDPWKDQTFGSAGNVSQDLVDPAFDTPACH